MMTSKQFRKLSGSAVKVLLDICTWHNGFNNRKIVCSYKQLADNLGLGKTTISDALKELKKQDLLFAQNLDILQVDRPLHGKSHFLKVKGMSQPICGSRQNNARWQIVRT